MATVPKLMTAEELWAMPDDGYHRYELLRGELIVMAPAGSEHGSVGMVAAYHLMQHVWPSRIGKVYNSDTGFVLSRDPDILFCPDAAFVRAERIPPGGTPRGFFPGAPDLAVEVVSPSDSRTQVEAKAATYLAHGTRLVWVIDPPTQTVRVFRPGGEVVELGADDTLDGGDVLPGLSCAVRDLFA